MGINCPWWNISSHFTDITGVNLFYQIKKQYPKVFPVNALGTKIYIVTSSNYIKQILDQSPFVFGVGRLKYDFFKTFMKDNVGVSQGEQWIQLRKFNEFVLETGCPHQYLHYYDQIIASYLEQHIPKNFNEFQYCSRVITTHIVFGNDKINSSIFDIFPLANQAYLDKTDIKHTHQYQEYLDYLNQSIDCPQKDSLVCLAEQIKPPISRYLLINQIPHWIFPLVGLISVSIPRTLLLILNDNRVLNKLRHEVKKNNSYQIKYLKYCILESLRLNNPVNSTFRTLLENYSFDGHHYFREGDQFLIINNPVLRDPNIFPNPNAYYPERWNEQLEMYHYNLIFNQGPQKCPGEDLAIGLMKIFIYYYLDLSGVLNGNKIITKPIINIQNVPQMINPCRIEFKI